MNCLIQCVENTITKMRPNPPRNPESPRGSDLQFRHHADSVGFGVHKQRITPGVAPNEIKAEEEVSLDGPVEWIDEPTYPDQINRGPQYFKLDRIEVKVYNLSIPDEAVAYSKLLSEAGGPASNKFILHKETKYGE